MSGPPEEWIVDEGEAGQRLDLHAAARLGCSRAGARRLIEIGGLRLGGRRTRAGQRVAAGERVTVDGTPPTEDNLRPVPEPALDLALLLVDERVVAVAKPAGQPCHPLRPGETGTLAGALVARYPECRAIGDDPREAGLVHRLDRETSGVLLAARDAEAWASLRRAFHEGLTRKTYLALVAGDLAAAAIVERPLAHLPADRRRMAVVEIGEDGAQAARTEVRPLGRAPGVTLVEARMATGRMHQVRAHLAHLGHPLVGDELYGGPPHPGGHLLHALRLECPHPAGGRIDVTAPLPEGRAGALRALGLALDGLY